MATYSSRIPAAAAVGVLIFAAALGLAAWHASASSRDTVVMMGQPVMLSSTAEKAAEAKALFHLAGGHHMLQDAKSGITDDSELKHKDKDALDILGSIFGGNKKASDQKPDGTVPQKRGRAATGSAGGGVHENAELEKMKEREAQPPESPAQALEGLIAAWSGAAWWQPCAEVCAPPAGSSHDKAAFLKFQSCEQLCRKKKTEDLKKAMSKIKTTAGAGGPPHKPMAPRTVQKLSKFLLKWAEG
jgi:hypothetical protein